MLGNIIPHFSNYPLLTTKVTKFIIWEKSITLVESNAHKTDNGFMTLLCNYAAIGRGASITVKNHFPNIIPTVLPDYKLPNKELNP
jgi:hypothetical protein